MGAELLMVWRVLPRCIYNMVVIRLIRVDGIKNQLMLHQYTQTEEHSNSNSTVTPFEHKNIITPSQLCPLEYTKKQELYTAQEGESSSIDVAV